MNENVLEVKEAGAKNLAQANKEVYVDTVTKQYYTYPDSAIAQYLNSQAIPFASAVVTDQINNNTGKMEYNVNGTYPIRNKHMFPR